MPRDDTTWRFGPFQLHPTQGLARGGQEIHVTPKSLAVLTALVKRSGEIVSKEELFHEVWRGTLVTDSALSSCIRELRRALDDDARSPRYLETIHRRGFRLLPDLGREHPQHPSGVAPGEPWDAEASLPGRADALGRLVELHARVRSGATEVVFATGPPGIGKTTLVEHFFSAIPLEEAQRSYLTQYIEPGAEGDAYGPLLELLTRLCVGSIGSEAIPVMRSCALSWFAGPSNWPSPLTLSSAAVCPTRHPEVSRMDSPLPIVSVIAWPLPSFIGSGAKSA